MRSFLAVLLCSTGLFAAGELSHRRAPGFSIVDAAMQQHDLADYRGKYVILDIMQTTCAHCQKFSEILEKISIQYRPKVQPLSLVVPPDSLPIVQTYIRTHNITIPMLFDCGQVAASYLRIGPSRPTVTFPHAFLIDPQGNIVNDWGYDPETKEIFEGGGLSKELDRVLGAGKK